MQLSSHQTFFKRQQTGLSIIELMVSIVIGLFIVGGALYLFMGNVDSSRRLLLQARLHQDLRAATDLVTRDLRRASYWNSAVTYAGTTTANPNTTLSCTGSTISYSLDNTAGTTSAVSFGLANNALTMQIGNGTAQQITDPAVTTIDSFSVSETDQTVNLSNICANGCTTTTCPQIVERYCNITLTGHSTNDTTNVRTLVTSVRIRNDAVSGTCPP